MEQDWDMGSLWVEMIEELAYIQLDSDQLTVPRKELAEQASILESLILDMKMMVHHLTIRLHHH